MAYLQDAIDKSSINARSCSLTAVHNYQHWYETLRLSLRSLSLAEEENARFMRVQKLVRRARKQPSVTEFKLPTKYRLLYQHEMKPILSQSCVVTQIDRRCHHWVNGWSVLLLYLVNHVAQVSSPRVYVLHRGCHPSSHPYPGYQREWISQQSLFRQCRQLKLPILELPIILV